MKNIRFVTYALVALTAFQLYSMNDSEFFMKYQTLARSNEYSLNYFYTITEISNEHEKYQNNQNELSNNFLTENKDITNIMLNLNVCAEDALTMNNVLSIACKYHDMDAKTYSAKMLNTRKQFFSEIDNLFNIVKSKPLHIWSKNHITAMVKNAHHVLAEKNEQSCTRIVESCEQLSGAAAVVAMERFLKIPIGIFGKNIREIMEHCADASAYLSNSKDGLEDGSSAIKLSHEKSIAELQNTLDIIMKLEKLLPECEGVYNYQKIFNATEALLQNNEHNKLTI